jgi:SAM-dependent methyltransferase
MEADYAQAYSALYHGHWWWQARQRLVLQWLRHLAPPGGFGPILDVGCGDGLLFDRLRELGRPEGVEADAALVTAGGRARGPIHVGPFDRASFVPDRRYGLILMLDVLEHLDHPRAALRYARELLAPGGRLLLTVPALQALWTGHDEMNHHRRRYHRPGLAAEARAAGLRVETLQYFNAWLVAAKLARRLTEALLRPEQRPPQIPPPWLNRALYALTWLDHRLQQRLPLPVGASLLMVGSSSTEQANLPYAAG